MYHPVCTTKREEVLPEIKQRFPSSIIMSGTPDNIILMNDDDFHRHEIMIAKALLMDDITLSLQKELH